MDADIFEAWRITPDCYDMGQANASSLGKSTFNTFIPGMRLRKGGNSKMSWKQVLHVVMNFVFPGNGHHACLPAVRTCVLVYLHFLSRKC